MDLLNQILTKSYMEQLNMSFKFAVIFSHQTSWEGEAVSESGKFDHDTTLHSLYLGHTILDEQIKPRTWG